MAQWGRERPTPTRSKLIGPQGPIRVPVNAAKRRRTIPWSTWGRNPAPTIPEPKEFDLGDFAFTYLPDPHTSYGRYNDDLVISHYQPAVRSFSGTQRKGLAEPFPGAESYDSHIQAALNAIFPMSDPTPLPEDLRNALYFNRGNPPETVAAFRSAQLKRMRIIADECRHETDRWYSFAPEPIKSSVGKIHIALLAHISRFTRMRGTNWLMQFVTGFPITGTLSQSGVFPADTAPFQGPIDPESLFETKSSRFRMRAPKANSRSPQQLWEEAISQVEKGWLFPPNR